MNQPKFKFGDKVYFPGRRDHAGCIYEIKGILLYESSTSYFLEGMSDSPIHESHLELCKAEPQKKKLYAYSMEDGKVDHFKTEQQGYDYYVHHSYTAKRDPDYDIEYPAETK